MAEAEMAKNYDGQRIWACDRKKTDRTVGKFFIVKSPSDIYKYLTDARRSELTNWYEVIGKDSPCCLYLDVEVGVLSEAQTSCFEDSVLAKRLDFLSVEEKRKVRPVIGDITR
jgi:hypothetical protein